MLFVLVWDLIRDQKVNIPTLAAGLLLYYRSYDDLAKDQRG